MEIILSIVFFLCTAAGNLFYAYGKPGHATYWLVIAAIILISYHH